MIHSSSRLAVSLTLLLALIATAGPAIGQVFIVSDAGSEVELQATKAGLACGASGVAAIWLGRADSEHLAIRADAPLRDGTVLRFTPIVDTRKEIDLGSAKTELGSAYLHVDSLADAGSAAFPLGRLIRVQVYHDESLLLEGDLR